jgi:hypothetical protein
MFHGGYMSGALGLFILAGNLLCPSGHSLGESKSGKRLSFPL